MAIELSYDLVEEILTRLPAKALARLRYTCKQWETLIANPRFAKKQFSGMRCREQQFTAFDSLSDSKASYRFGSIISCVGIDFDDLNYPGLNLQLFKPVSSSSLLVRNMYHCDGLLLLVLRRKLLVVNPLVKQERWVRCSRRTDCSLDAYGLGYISCDDYRIVRFPCGAHDGGKYKGTRIELYEFKSDYWRVFADKSFDGFLELPESSVCLRGTPYWIGHINGKTVPTIQSFDFSKERFETLFLPPSSYGATNFENYLDLGVFRGDKLSLLHKSRSTGKIRLWVMEKHWNKLMTFAIPGFDMFHRYSSFFIEYNGKLVISIRDVSSIHVSIVGKDDDCQSVVYPSMDSSFGGSVCYYVPSLLQVPGSFEAKSTRSVFPKKRGFLTMDPTE